MCIEQTMNRYDYIYLLFNYPDKNVSNTFGKENLLLHPCFIALYLLKRWHYMAITFVKMQTQKTTFIPKFQIGFRSSCMSKLLL